MPRWAPSGYPSLTVVRKAQLVSRTLCRQANPRSCSARACCPVLAARCLGPAQAPSGRPPCRALPRPCARGPQVREEALKKAPMGNRQETHDAIRALLASLGDPFTRFLAPDQYNALR